MNFGSFFLLTLDFRILAFGAKKPAELHIRRTNMLATLTS